MRENRSFWKAVHSLSHPLSVLAILLLLFNDHYLRWHYHSWLTGKLGDFTWLVFAPFIAAMLFSWLSPQKTRFIGLLSIGFIGLWFASFKTIPIVMDLTKTVLEALVGWRGSLGMDASDLLTLPALIMSWHIWKHAREDKQYLRPVIYVAFGLGIMGTLASDYVISDYQAINLICELPDGRLQTFSTEYLFDTETQSSVYSRVDLYESTNGGYSWQYLGRQDVDNISNFTIPDARCSDRLSRNTINTENGLMYRWERGERIEYSTDGGTTWLLLRDLYELRQEVRTRFNHNYAPDDEFSSSAGGPFYVESPVSGLVHSQTGNLVLAMSRDGVLVIMPSGESHWVGVGENQLVELYSWDVIRNIVGGYSVYTLTLFFLILVTAIVIIHRPRKLLRYLLVIGWINWLILHLPALPLDFLGDFGDDFLIAWAILELASLVFIAVPMSLWALYHLLWHYRGAILQLLIAAFVPCLANLFPIFLWSQGTIPSQGMAMVFSLGLTAAVLATCYAYFRPKLPARIVFEKEKRKNDAL